MVGAKTFIANNSGHEPAVGTRVHNRMSVRTTTNFINRYMEVYMKGTDIWKARKNCRYSQS